MRFVEDNLYHIYNRGNNKRPIFFLPDNYIFFLKNVRHFILPYCDILNYCLMPNYFHFLVSVKSLPIIKYKQTDLKEVTKSNHTVIIKTERHPLSSSFGYLLRLMHRLSINKITPVVLYFSKRQKQKR